MSKAKFGNKRKSPGDVVIPTGIKEESSSSSTDQIAAPVKKDSISQKRMRVNQTLNSKLHILTNTDEVPVLAHIPGRKTGCKNDNIWDSKIALSQSETYLSESVVVENVIPSVENLRHRCVAESKEYLKTLCQEHSIIPPLMAWERWQANSILMQQLSKPEENRKDSSNVSFSCPTNCFTRIGRSTLISAVDYILPENKDYIDEGLVQDLVRGGFKDNGSATSVSKRMSAHSQDLVAKIRNYVNGGSAAAGLPKLTGNKKQRQLQQEQRTRNSNLFNLQPTILEHKHSYDIYLGNKPKNFLKLNRAHYIKLKELYLLHRKNNCIDQATIPKTESDQVIDVQIIQKKGATDEETILKEFHTCLYTMLARYNALLGHGMQCALPEDVFDVLHSHVQTNFECFASPLNCRYSSFCSAFPDTDGAFGGKGSFFDFYPTKGSYEVNPPFIEGIMLASVKHVLDLLTSVESLSFTFVIPGMSLFLSHMLTECPFAIKLSMPLLITPYIS